MLFRLFVVTSLLGFEANAHPSPSSCFRIAFGVLCSDLSYAFWAVIQQASSRSSSVSRSSLQSDHLLVALQMLTDCFRTRVRSSDAILFLVH